ncbi:hypothetical protein JW906_11345 [bacterium]|nr:hypothetical protein [bacterium]
MPVYDQNYRPWEGRLLEKPRTWWVIARTGIRLLWQRWMIALLFFASFPFIVRTVQIYFMNRVGDASKLGDLGKNLDIDAGFFQGFLKNQEFILLLILVTAGAGLIANDRRFKALQIYFSRPVSFPDYICGKWLILAFYGGLATCIPALLLFIIQWLLSGSEAFLRQFFWIPFSVLGFSVTVLLVLGGLMLLLSSISSARGAAVLFFAVIWFGEILRKILIRIPELGLLSLQANLRQVGSVFFGTERPFEFSAVWAAVVLAAFVAGCILALRMRVRPTEVVK